MEGDKRKATLEAGRRKLDEFRKKKEAALAAKKMDGAPALPPEAVAGVPPPPPAPTAPASRADDSREADSLRDQVAQLLRSVDDLHRALQDERHNSAQLEDQLEQALARAVAGAAEGSPAGEVHAAMEALQSQVSELQRLLAGAQQAAEAGGEAQAELQASRAAAAQQAAAAEALLAELAEARQCSERLQAEVEDVQQAFTLVADYKQQVEKLQEQLATAAHGASSNAAELEDQRLAAAYAEEKVSALASRLAEQQEAASRLEAELEQQRDVAARMRAATVEQAAVAEAAAAAEGAELEAERAKGREAAGRMDRLMAELAEARAALQQRQQAEQSLLTDLQELASTKAAYDALRAELTAAQEAVTLLLADNERLGQELAAAGDVTEAARLQRGALQEAEAQLAAAVAEAESLWGQNLQREGELTQRKDAEAALHEQLEQAQVAAAAGEQAAAAQAAVQAERDAVLRDLQESQAARGAAELAIASMQATLEQAQQEAAASAEDAAALREQLLRAVEGRQGSDELAAQLAAAQLAAAELQADLVGATATAQEAAQQRDSYADELTSLMEQTESIMAEKTEAEAGRGDAVATVERLQLALREQSTAAAAPREAVAALEVLQAEAESLRQQVATAAAEKERTVSEAGFAAQETQAELLLQLEDAQRRLAMAEGLLQGATQGAEQAEQAADAAASAAGAQEESEALRQQLLAAQQEANALVDRVAELEKVAAAAQLQAAAALQVEDMQRENQALQAAVAEYQVQSQRYAHRVQQLEVAAAAGSACGDAAVRLQHVQRQAAEQGLLATNLQAEVSALRAQLEGEQRRAAQLEAFSQRQLSGPLQRPVSGGYGGNKKDEDGTMDVEAAALAGGGTFKPLVGVVRSLPAPLNHPVVVQFLSQGAMHLDKAAVALDGRPHIRAGLVLYFVLLHILLLI